MACVSMLGSSVDMAVGDKSLPSLRDRDVVKCFPRSDIWAVPFPLVELFSGKAVVLEKNLCQWSVQICREWYYHQGGGWLCCEEALGQQPGVVGRRKSF